MNSNDNRNRTQESCTVSEEILTRDLFDTIRSVIVCFISPVICTFGLASNTLNMKVFATIGLSDSLTICFFCLSMSDLICLSVRLVDTFVYYKYLSNPGWPVKIYDISYILVWYYCMFYDISTVITTYLAVQRACCVALPFQMKDFFTKSRTLCTIVFLIAVIVISYIPVLSTQSLITSKRPGKNVTIVVIHYLPGRSVTLNIVDTFNNLILVLGSQILILLSLVAIAVCIRASMKFRTASKYSNKAADTFSEGKQKQGRCRTRKLNKLQQTDLQQIRLQELSHAKRTSFVQKTPQHPRQHRHLQQTEQQVQMRESAFHSDNKYYHRKTRTLRDSQDKRHGQRSSQPEQKCQKQQQITQESGQTMLETQRRTFPKLKSFSQKDSVKKNDDEIIRHISNKEMRIVRQIAVLSLLFLLCNIPQTLAFIARLVREVTDTRRYSNLYLLFYKIINIFEFTNCSVTCIIYYKYNTKFREITNIFLNKRKRRN